MVKGRSPADIPLARNSQTVAWINPALAERIGFKPDPELLDECRRVE